MQTINIHEAKTQLSRLVEQAVDGEPFIIAKAGKPMVIVSKINSLPKQIRRVGFLTANITIPDDFDEIGRNEIAALFGGGVA